MYNSMTHIVFSVLMDLYDENLLQFEYYRIIE